MIVFIPAFVALLFFFIPGSLLANIRIKISALIIFILVFLLYASPKFDQIGYYSAHRTLSGFMTPFDARLGVTRPVYDWGYQYSDDFVWANTYAQAKAIVPAYNFSYSANEYNRLGLDYIWKIATYFPADMLTRTYAAVLKILELPFTYIEPPVGITNQFIIDLYAWRAKIMNLLAGSGFFLVVITLLLVSTVSLRKAIFCLFFLLYFAGYPVLHFQGRHYFHLEFISWWSLGFVLQQTMLFINRIAHRDVVGYLSQLKPSSAKRMLCFAAGSLMILLIPLFLLRQYQSWKVGNLLHAYANADTERLPLREQPLRNNIVLMTNPEQFKPALQGSVSADYLVAEFCNQHCDYSTVWPILRYGDDSVSGRPSFSRSMRINLANFDTMSRRVFFPAISYNEASCGSAYFKGIEMSREQVDCLCGLYRVKDPSQFPLLLTMSLPVTAGDNNLYQMLAAEKTNGIYTIPANMSDTLVKELLRHPLSSLTPDEIVFKADNVYLKANQWVIKGYARSQPDPYNQPALDRTQSLVARTLFVEQSVGIVDTDLLRTKDIRLKKGNYFVAQGRLYVGGFTLGLMKNGQSAGFVNITDRGLFTVIIEVPADGLYSLGLANNLDGYTSLENRFVITKAGWVGY